MRHFIANLPTLILPTSPHSEYHLIIFSPTKLPNKSLCLLLFQEHIQLRLLLHLWRLIQQQSFIGSPYHLVPEGIFIPASISIVFYGLQSPSQILFHFILTIILEGRCNLILILQIRKIKQMTAKRFVQDQTTIKCVRTDLNSILHNSRPSVLSTLPPNSRHIHIDPHPHHFFSNLLTKSF